MAKPEVVFFVYSEGAMGQTLPPPIEGYEPVPRLNLMGVLCMLRPYFVPGQFSFAVSLGLRNVDFTQPHRVRFVFRHENKVIVDTDYQPVVIEHKQQTLPVEEAHIMTSITFANVILETEGLYHTDVYFDGELLGAFPIPVRKAAKSE
ncbi:MAG: hypothetical protein K6T81_18340 [Alicyclobacillus macrosporangiidus]|uniref:DUF6941 family protein n=1 Tax=Alicyclobacillus macrosporangiidus TaxID=392015 RepID=UPI0026EC2DCE|nr:hypothetical protein [Alicyclobacillus macrosporangiidus]MCL6600668.1 hypothetical protein [Alicyclobacillus macrosporangiidus]